MGRALRGTPNNGCEGDYPAQDGNINYKSKGIFVSRIARSFHVLSLSEPTGSAVSHEHGLNVADKVNQILPSFAA